MERIHEEISKAKTIAIAGHIKPDGDCMGSTLGLYNYILKRYPNVEVDVFAEAIPPAFAFMKGADKIILDYEGRESYDLFFSLDCGDIDRLGKAGKAFKDAIK